MPRKLKRRPLLVALAGVVEDDVENHLQAGGVERAHHLLELAHLGPGLLAGGEALVGREEAQGVVAPVVGEAARLEEALGHRLVHRHQLHRGDAQLQQVVDGRRVRQAGVGAAQVGRNAGVLRGEALDVQLVDDGLAPDDLGADLAVPVELVVHHHAAGHAVGVVAGVLQLAAVLDDVAHQGRVPVGLAQHRAGVGVDQQLVGVEAQAALRGPGPVHAKAVERARRAAGARSRGRRSGCGR